MTVAARRPSLERLADTLGSERRVVEYLLFKLVAAMLLLAADEHRFVPPALDEVERVVAALRDAERERTAALTVTAREWGVPARDLSLSELVRTSPEPMATVFREHQAAFTALAEEIEETAADNRRARHQRADPRPTGPRRAHRTPGGRHLHRGRPHDTAVTSPTRLDAVL